MIPGIIDTAENIAALGDAFARIQPQAVQLKLAERFVQGPTDPEEQPHVGPQSETVGRISGSGAAGSG